MRCATSKPISSITSIKYVSRSPPAKRFPLRYGLHTIETHRFARTIHHLTQQKSRNRNNRIKSVLTSHVTFSLFQSHSRIRCSYFMPIAILNCQRCEVAFSFRCKIAQPIDIFLYCKNLLNCIFTFMEWYSSQIQGSYKSQNRAIYPTRSIAITLLNGLFGRQPRLRRLQMGHKETTDVQKHVPCGVTARGVAGEGVGPMSAIGESCSAVSRVRACRSTSIATLRMETSVLQRHATASPSTWKIANNKDHQVNNSEKREGCM